MSGIGTDGKSGAPPIGHGPSAVTHSNQRRADNKKNKNNKQNEQDETGRESHDEFAVKVDASFFNLSNGDILEGTVTRRESEKRLLLDSATGHFILTGEVNLSVGEKATIKVLKSHQTIDAVVVAAAGIKLSMPIPVVISPIDIHLGTLAPEINKADENIQPNITYSPQKQVKTGNIPNPQEDTAFVMATTNVGGKVSPQIQSPKIKAKPNLACQDLSTLIEASANNSNQVKHKIKQTNNIGHDSRPSILNIVKSYEQDFPQFAEDLNKMFFGLNGLIPSGLSYFLAGLIFDDVQKWVGYGVAKQYDNHPHFKELKNDFNSLYENTHCLANENWRLLVHPHPQGEASRAIKIISNIQTGHGKDGSAIEMRSVVSQLNFNEANGEHKALGTLQIEAILMPGDYSLIFRFANELEPTTRADIERLTMSYFAKAGVNGHILFAPLSAGHINFGEIVNQLSLEAKPPSIST